MAICFCGKSEFLFRFYLFGLNRANTMEQQISGHTFLVFFDFYEQPYFFTNIQLSPFEAAQILLYVLFSSIHFLSVFCRSKILIWCFQLHFHKNYSRDLKIVSILLLFSQMLNLFVEILPTLVLVDGRNLFGLLHIFKK